MSEVLTKEVQAKLMDYFQKQHDDAVIRLDQFDLLDEIVHAKHNTWQAEYIQKLDFKNLTDKKIKDNAEELMETIILEDIYEDLRKCSRDKVIESLTEWIEEFNSYD